MLFYVFYVVLPSWVTCVLGSNTRFLKDFEGPLLHHLAWHLEAIQSYAQTIKNWEWCLHPARPWGLFYATSMGLPTKMAGLHPSPEDAAEKATALRTSPWRWRCHNHEPNAPALGLLPAEKQETYLRGVQKQKICRSRRRSFCPILENKLNTEQIYRTINLKDAARALLKKAADTGRAKASKPENRCGPTKATDANGAMIWQQWMIIPAREVKIMERVDIKLCMKNISSVPPDSNLNLWTTNNT